MRKFFSEHVPTFKIITREKWGAMPSRGESGNPLKFPINYVLMMDTGSVECKTKEECIVVVSSLQKKFMEELNFDDIPWSFLVGGDGNAYEGRGWGNTPIKTDLKNRKQKRYDGRSIDVAYIGNYQKRFPSLPMQHGFTNIMLDGINSDRLPLIFHIRRFVKKAKIAGRINQI